MGISLLAVPSEVRIAVNRARSAARAQGFQLVVTSTKRTRLEQQTLFDQFQLGNRRFPVAPPGTSRHEIGLAIDGVAIPADRLPDLVVIMRSVGFKWAGPDDFVHFDFILPLGRPEDPAEPPLRPVVESVLPPQGFPTRTTRAARPGPSPCFL